MKIFEIEKGFFFHSFRKQQKNTELETSNCKQLNVLISEIEGISHSFNIIYFKYLAVFVCVQKSEYNESGVKNIPQKQIKPHFSQKFISLTAVCFAHISLDITILILI